MRYLYERADQFGEKRGGNGNASTCGLVSLDCYCGRSGVGCVLGGNAGSLVLESFALLLGSWCYFHGLCLVYIGLGDEAGICGAYRYEK